MSLKTPLQISVGKLFSTLVRCCFCFYWNLGLVDFGPLGLWACPLGFGPLGTKAHGCLDLWALVPLEAWALGYFCILP